MQTPSRPVGRSSGGLEILHAVFPTHPSSNLLFSPSPSLPLRRSPLLPIFRRPPIAVEATTVHSLPTADEEPDDRAKLAEVAKRLESISRRFKQLGGLGFGGQLVCTVAGSVILSCSMLINLRFQSPLPAAFFAAAAGVAAAFVSVFRSFGYMRLAERLRRTVDEPAKAPPRAAVVKNLKNVIVLNLVGMGAAVVAMQATVGLLFVKALTANSPVPYYQGIPPGQIPVVASDVFLVQASASTVLSHLLGLVCSLELLRSVTVPHVEVFPILKRA